MSGVRSVTESTMMVGSMEKAIGTSKRLFYPAIIAYIPAFVHA
jgi:hypothetical protein